MAEIVLNNVVKRYPDGALAVEDFNLTIADGEFIILVGPSGCGKSTTLNMIAGLEDITTGDLLIDGTRVNDRAPKDRDIAMVFQSYALYPHMTVEENMAFPLVLAKVDKATIKQKVHQAAEMLELTQHLSRKPANLSGGQRQRVAMGRAIVRSPKAFLMDEPLSNLDAKLRVQMRTQVSRIQKTLGTTTVYVTHDQTEAMTLGDRVVVMRGGVVQQVGSPTELYQSPANLFVAGFIGSPSMNFLPATIEGGALDSGLGRIEMPDQVRRAVEAASGKEVIVGLRPEHFEDATLAGDAHGTEVEVGIDLVESMGSDVYAYFTVGGAAHAADLDELAKDVGQDMQGSGTQVTARLSADSRVAPGQRARLLIDTTRMQVFDAETGTNLTADGTAERGASGGASGAADGGSNGQGSHRAAGDPVVGDQG
ncbi:sn-glycerol-3-phosphate ABC transporter ATP-binding protein UgpC [Nocardioides dubius]|uniref:Sn-glycerol-3-phosphate ABC transporter ATP-binding protein UgpC n=1 Tax=Nocardioides dubius TaxID=317019 RepID=A0ABN1TZZ8_9ACTN